MIDTISLKNKILRLALSGKLVNQINGECSVDELISKLSNQRFNKKVITEEETLYEIPNSWQWCRFSDIVEFHLGKTPARANKDYWNNGEIPWISISDIPDSGKIIRTKEKVSKFAADECFSKEISKAGTLIMSFKLTIGKVAILDIDAFHNEAIISIFPRYDEDNIFRDFLFWALPVVASDTSAHGVVMGSTLNKKSLSDMVVPVPPLSEQKRIVEKLNEIFDIINTIDALQSSYSSDLEVLKSKIIDAGIQGKLTEQLLEDGNAKELYAAIQEEKRKIYIDRKARKDNKIKPVESDTPFVIPDNWRWIRFGDVGLFKKGPFGSALTKSMFVPKGENTIKVYEQQHVINKDDSLGTYYITKEYFDEKMRGFEVLPGDIIVSCAGTIGETYIMPENIEQGIINQALMRVTLPSGINKKFFQYYFDANLKKSAQEESNGSAIKNIPPFDVLKNWYFPLVPYKEQLRIVNKIDSILATLDQKIEI